MTFSDEIEPLNEANGELAGRPQSPWARRWWPLGLMAALTVFLGTMFLNAGPQGLQGQGLRGVVGLQGWGAVPAALPPCTALVGCAPMYPTTPCPSVTTPCPPVTTPCPPVTTPCPPVTLPATTPCPPGRGENLPVTLPATLPPPTAGHMELKEPWDLTYAWDDDDIEVYFVSSPLLRETTGRLFAAFGLFHTGVWFKNSRTGLDSTVQFYATVFGPHLIMPTLDYETHQMTWDTNAIVATKEGQLDSYWTKREQVATIKGNHYNQYIKWVEGTAKKYTSYFLFNLATKGHQVAHPHGPEAAAEAGFPPGSLTCTDFAQLVLQEIKDLAGAEAFIKEGIEVNDAYLWVKPGTQPRKLDMTPGSPDFEVAWKFFDALNSIVQVGSELGKTDLKVVLGNIHKTFTEAGLTSAVYVDKNRAYWSYTPDEDFGRYYLTSDAPMYQ